MTQHRNILQFTATKTRCPRRHPLSGENLYITPKGTRACRECNREAQRRLGALARDADDRSPFKHVRLPRGAPILDRIKMRIVEQDGPLDTPCWVWMGSLCGPGYGQIRVTQGGRSRRVLVHRWMYEHYFGPPPAGTEVHHKCDIPRCVNPEHLEAIPHAQNIRKTTSQITHCNHGHPLSGDNLRITSDGTRVCRACLYSRVPEHVKKNDEARKKSLANRKR